MKNLIYFIVLFICSTLFATVKLGSQIMDGSKNIDQTVALGDNALSRAENITDSIVIGETAGLKMKSNNNVIAIGKGALSGTEYIDGTVAIGQYEMFGESYNRDTTSINGKQLWISKPLEAFCINPNKERDITKTPFYYINGELHINAPIVNESWIIDSEYDMYLGEYDMFLSENGNDANDGLSPRKAKKTIDGIYAAATNSGMRVGVFPGDYAPPKNYDAKSNPKQFIPHTTSLEFIAIEGRGKTSISGIYEDGPSGTNGCYHTLAFAEGNHVFRGFKINNISGYYNTGGFSASNKYCPAFSCITLVDCEVTCDTLNYYHYYGAFNACMFSNCVVRIGTIKESSSTTAISPPNTFAGCTFVETELRIDASESPVNRWKMFYKANAKNSLFILPPPIENEVLSTSYSSSAENCTIIYDAPEGAIPRFIYSKATNSYYAVGTGTVGTGDNAFAPSWTNTLLNADYVPMSIDCPAVRDDGRKDAGWKDSGLGCQKSFAARANIRIENGALVVYQGGVVIGTIPMDAVATTLKAPRPTASPAPVEEEDPEDESVILLNRL